MAFVLSKTPECIVIVLSKISPIRIAALLCSFRNFKEAFN